jgi:hypothetical protein
MDALAIIRKFKPKTPLERALSILLAVLVGLLPVLLKARPEHQGAPPPPIINININQARQGIQVSPASRE